jgi:predicted adenylyl cyclase CyaB
VIFYQRPDKPGPKGSSYQRIEVGEPKTLKIILEKILGCRGIISKKRILYLLDKTRIHLDEVEGLGRFLELEVVLEDESQAPAGKKIIAALRDLLGIEDQDLVSGSYIDLLEKREEALTTRKTLPSV